MEKLHCRVCMDGIAESLGKIPECREFAGQLITPPIQGGVLWHCRACGSMFRYPTLTSEDYISLYKKAPNTVWTKYENERNDFSTIYTYLNSHPGGAILDIGCYAGDFLMGLPERFIKFGVEPSDSALKSATSKCVSILGASLDKLESDKCFDVVVSIDVIEHVLDVEGFLSQALAHTKENGLLIISTGNPDCFFWKKVFKGQFWYSYYAEHVTFPSYGYYADFAKRHGLQPPEQILFNYHHLKLKSLVSTWSRFVFRYLLRKIKRLIQRITRGIAAKRPAPMEVRLVGIFTDHHIIVFRKRELGKS